jgi:hypothetical protein
MFHSWLKAQLRMLHRTFYKEEKNTKDVRWGSRNTSSGKLISHVFSPVRNLDL